MPTTSQRSIGFLSGNVHANDVTFVVASYTDAAITVAAYTNEARTGSPVFSRTINASAGASPKLAKYCDDRGSNDPAGVTYACWVGSSTLTGLAAGTRYFLKLTQGAVVESDAETWTAPAAGTDFNVYVVSCDISFRQIGNATIEPGPGCWPAIRQEQASGLPGYIVWADDIAYADGLGYYVVPVDSRPDDTGYSGKKMTGTAATTLKAYDFAITYLCLLGMLGNTAYSAVAWGRETDRLHCLRTLPLAVQWGDHETTDGCSEQATSAQAQTGWAPGVTAFDNLFGLLRPQPSGGDIRVLDASARHWALDLGDLRILAPDPVTNAAGGDFVNYPYTCTAVLGTNQIDDLLTAAGSSHQFKILIESYMGERDWRETINTALLPGEHYAHAPLCTMQPTEWARLFFNKAQTPLSLMDNPKTNGADGVMVVLRGDYHAPHVLRQYGWKDVTGTVADTHLRADWTVLNIAPMTNNNIPTVAAATQTRVDSRFWRGMQMHECYRTASGRVLACGQVQVRGTLSPKRMTCRILRAAWQAETSYEPFWSGEWRPGSNRPINHLCVDREIV